MAKASIDEHIDKLLGKNPILLDGEFKKKFPGIEFVAAFINAKHRTAQKASGRYKLFDKLGIGDIGEYLELLQQGDKVAIRSYEITRDSLGFGQDGS